MGTVQAASFDCAQATTSIEKRICIDEELSRLDDVLDHAYQAVRVRADVVRDQRRWIATRNACNDAVCIRRAYQDRIAQLADPKYRVPEAIASKRSGPSYFATVPRSSIDEVINGCFSDAACGTRLEKIMAENTASGVEVANKALKNCLYSQRTMNICVATWLDSLKEELQETVSVVSARANAQCNSRLQNMHNAWSIKANHHCGKKAFDQTGGGEATSGLESSCQIGFYQRAIVTLWDSEYCSNCKKCLRAFELPAP